MSRAVGVVVSHPLSMQEALGSIPGLSMHFAIPELSCLLFLTRPKIFFSFEEKVGSFPGLSMPFAIPELSCLLFLTRPKNFFSFEEKVGGFGQLFLSDSASWEVLIVVLHNKRSGDNSTCRLYLHRITSAVIPLQTHPTKERQPTTEDAKMPCKANEVAFTGLMTVCFAG